MGNTYTLGTRTLSRPTSDYMAVIHYELIDGVRYHCTAQYDGTDVASGWRCWAGRDTDRGWVDYFELDYFESSWKEELEAEADSSLQGQNRLTLEDNMVVRKAILQNDADRLRSRLKALLSGRPLPQDYQT